MRFREAYATSSGAPEPEPAPLERRAPPWERQAHEPDHAFVWFQAYLYSKASGMAEWLRGAPQVPARDAYTLARAWAWSERRRALHEHLARESALVATEEAADRAREHVRLWRLAREVAARSLEALAARAEEMSAKETLAYVEACTKWERLIDGEATGRVALDLTGASPEELAALEQAQRVIEGIGKAPALDPGERAN